MADTGIDIGVEGNQRLTSSIGLVLAVILLVEGPNDTWLTLKFRKP